MNRIKAVIFDVGGVLHETDIATDQLLRTELEMDDATMAQFYRDDINQLGIGAIDEASLWQQAQQKYSIRPVTVGENLLGRAFAETLRPREEVLAIVDELGRTGLTLAILSNTIEPHARTLRERGIYARFDPVFLSHEIGLQKPDERIYRHVLSKLMLQPDEAAYTDDLSENITPAQTLGIHSILFEDAASLRAKLEELIPTFRY